MIEGFIRNFKPEKDLTKPTQELIDTYKDKLPKQLIKMWEKYGFGNYGYGIVKLIDPTDYIVYLKLKEGLEEEGIPFLLDGFGNMFYYKPDDSVHVINIEYNINDICAYTFKDFMERIVTEDFIRDFLKKDIIDELLITDKFINNNEIYVFNPPFFLGGAPYIQNITIKDITTYYDFIFPILMSFNK